jgi:hypothetical protein
MLAAPEAAFEDSGRGLPATSGKRGLQIQGRMGRQDR